ncbi:MAG: isoprenylcysteine carboxylmethyltransferase family protein [Chitinispirillales bacterium]|jgi:protein-S-isoprenylcysteine O-methyltransferase Ste14|nr:isoprenylcysteine carboxylmethyltransferase family protein [Chitinispirillales bacterium]
MALQEKLEAQGSWLFRHRGILPIFVLMPCALLYARTELVPGAFALEDTPYEFYYEMFAVLVSLAGAAIRAIAVGHTPANTSGRNTRGQVADELNVSGMYSMLRHPLYLGNFLMWLGVALWTGEPWFIGMFCLAFWLYYERIMFAEEQFLRRKFGAAFEEWAARTPAFFPDLRLFRRSAYPFSWKKCLRKEKTGLLALFLIFFAFDLFGMLVEQDGHYNLWIWIAFALSLAAYAAAKILNKYTGSLKDGRG